MKEKFLLDFAKSHKISKPDLDMKLENIETDWDSLTVLVTVLLLDEYGVKSQKNDPDEIERLVRSAKTVGEIVDLLDRRRE